MQRVGQTFGPVFALFGTYLRPPSSTPTHMRFLTLVRQTGFAALTATLFIGCKRMHSGESGGEIAETWTPSSASTAMNVPMSAITTSIASKLDAEPPAPLTKATWKRAKKLYGGFSNAPLWFTQDGLDKTRAGALMLSLADATSDGIRLQDFPLSALGAAIDSVSNTKSPTADQLANLDVLLTATFVSLSQDLMVGQIDPSTVNQSWHISSKDEKLDSARVRSIRADQLDKAIALMRPRDGGYDSLRIELARYRELAAKGFTAVPKGKALVVGSTDP